ncbi:NACHT domain-containing protein [Streptomyces sp. NPDC047002]|uniref:NACHT domain-containing protein n=1 Tax=Streptomyces sp. NPDC047002 TaxID=3155475 RepID=UPI00345701BE
MERPVVHNTFSGHATYVIQAGEIHGDVHIGPGRAGTPRGRAAAELADASLAGLREEAVARGLSRRARLAVRWTADQAVSDHPENVGAPPPLPDAAAEDGLARLAAAYRALPVRRLVLLGGPGAGKTSLAVLLAMELLATLTDDEPVPVLLPAASWEPGKEHFDTWFARRVLRDHGTSGALKPRLVRELVRDRLLLPVLDGFDELPAALRADALAGLARALGDDAPLVLTSRTDAYARAVAETGVLGAAAVIRAEPVPGTAAAGYLRTTSQPRHAPRLAPLLDDLARHPDGVAASALGTPLSLWLARTVYARDGADPGELLDRSRFPDAVSVERHLLDALVPAVLRAAARPQAPGAPGPARRRWDPGAAERHLAFLAAHLTRNRTGELAWWRLHRARLPAALEVPAALIAGLLVLLCLHPLAVAAAGGDPARLHRVAAGAAVAAGCAVVGAATAKALTARGGDLPRRPLLLRGILRPRLAAALALAAACACVDGLLLGGGSPLFLCVGLALPGLLMLALGVPADTDRAPGARQLLRDQRLSTWLMLLLACPALGVVAMAAVPEDPLPAAAADHARLCTWAAGALAGAAVVLLVSPWTRWLFAKALLAAAGRTPWSLLAFLEDARALGLVRQAGGAYTFRHARLQARLAARHGRGRAWARPLPDDGQPCARFAGHTGAALRRGRARLYVLPWGFALARVAQLSFEGGWDSAGSWLLIGILLLLPVAVDLAAPRAARRRSLLRLDAHGVEVTTRGTRLACPWTDVVEASVDLVDPHDRGAGLPMLHLRLRPGAPPPPGTRPDDTGRIAVWPLGRAAEATVPPELDRALRHYAGPRWTPWQWEE